jgi:hypothetical protein
LINFRIFIEQKGRADHLLTGDSKKKKRSILEVEEVKSGESAFLVNRQEYLRNLKQMRYKNIELEKEIERHSQNEALMNSLNYDGVIDELGNLIVF